MSKNTSNAEPARIRYALIFFFLIVIYAVAIAFIAYPLVLKNLEDIDFMRHIEVYREQKNHRDWLNTSAYLYSVNGLVETDREIETTARDTLHSTIEALLLPLSDEEIARGLVTYIPKKTKLIGMTESNGYIFVQFSNDLMFSSDLDKAIAQIEMTLKDNFNPREIEIISDGIIIN